MLSTVAQISCTPLCISLSARTVWQESLWCGGGGSQQAGAELVKAGTLLGMARAGAIKKNGSRFVTKEAEELENAEWKHLMHVLVFHVE